ncbi:hypothetical protein P170DRAFT_435350 [Aspergillus steynii IBT 23096]|uniref:Uncharacterized protein n=1 Tax=Aspergillus steynii IBT 23096 TaxID=1392250 RepID=A0A2I2GBB3_9EURO|nr:uncharacterized protein P170DRAFT_435350 [Aspergillus steynii IBT 23096]PLB50161.1 hypothetical protein P170DRAFT_435350 [Aspergillus steynii IBT 23096]
MDFPSDCGVEPAVRDRKLTSLGLGAVTWTQRRREGNSASNSPPAWKRGLEGKSAGSGTGMASQSRRMEEQSWVKSKIHGKLHYKLAGGLDPVLPRNLHWPERDDELDMIPAKDVESVGGTARPGGHDMTFGRIWQGITMQAAFGLIQKSRREKTRWGGDSSREASGDEMQEKVTR